MLLERFKDLWATIGVDRHEAPNERAFERAAAALMLEVTRADFTQTNDERAVVLALLRDTFALSAEEVAELEQQAKDEVDRSICLHGFVTTINECASYEDKIRLIEALWRIAFADGDLDKYEEHLIRRIADLLYIPHEVFIRAKLAAL